jgi:hypothetical protein
MVQDCSEFGGGLFGLSQLEICHRAQVVREEEGARSEFVWFDGLQRAQYLVCVPALQLDRSRNHRCIYRVEGLIAGMKMLALHRNLIRLGE